MVETVDNDSLGDQIGVLETSVAVRLRRDCFATHNFLDHVHDLLLDKVKALSIPSRGTTDHIVNLDIFVFLAHPTSFHGIGKLNEHGVLLHNALNMLSANTDDALVVLIWNMERDRSRHLLFNQIQAILDSFVLAAANIDIEIVLVESVEDDLNVA